LAAKKSDNKGSPKKQSRISQSDVPAYSIDDALRIPRAIHENYGGDPTKPLDVAAAMDVKPASSSFRVLTGSAIAYGLTIGGYNTKEILVSDLGTMIIRPLEDGADVAAKRQAFLKPKIIGEFLVKYDGSQLPKENIARNVLVNMGVPDERTEAVLSLIYDGAKSLGFLKEIKGTQYIDLAPAVGFVLETNDEDSEQEEKSSLLAEAFAEDTSHDEVTQELNVNSAAAASNRRVFITHGKNKSFIDPIRKLLKFGELEAVVSVEKQSVSKPVPEKVMTDMRSCGAAIIHVEGEMHLLDSEANEHVVLNPNVLIEIGAAMGLYGRRFILLVKEGVKLPSNLQGLYEVRYDGDALDGQATIQLLEAINEMKSENET